jgi:hypothetical protein
MYGYPRATDTGRVYRCSRRNAEWRPDRCDCASVSAEIIETRTWDTITAELTDPHRLAHLAGIAANPNTHDPDVDVSMIDRRIRRIEGALATQIADLLAAGRDATVIGLATSQLESELDTLRQHRTRVVAWAARRADRTAQLERIAAFAEAARATLANPTDEVRAQVVALLDTRVRVTDTIACPTCRGNGLLRRGQHPDGARRPKTGDICPTCRRTRTLPVIEITGLLPLTDNLSDTPPAEGAVPFRLHAIS